MTIRKLTDSDDLTDLVRKADAQGHLFVRRLVDEMTDGTNRFNRAGEAIFVAEVEGRICGVCGLNQDGFSGRPHTSRLRHLFIDPACRGQGVGSALVAQCLEVAQRHSDLIVLRTHCPDASAFYRKQGFTSSHLSGATHEMQLVQGTIGSART